MRLEDIKLDGNGVVIEPEILAGLPIDQVMSPMKRAMWVWLRKKRWVPAET